ncbi:hypothetical protein ACIBL3_04525 [Kribbella sp. NPDC050124]|uniref:hypothetical protein n=1 Tax=Kribbella sp. NPDC050124 TaxID=3364114 RepID=UPI0037942349
MNSTPQIPGYEFDQQLLAHPLAELWRGRSFTGMEVVALLLSEVGARDEVVRDRLVQAGRGAALEPGQLQTPLWAANFSADRPYAITQLVPGQSGAERLIDPLDGVLGNDEESLQAVRSQLSGYGAIPPDGPPQQDQPKEPEHKEQTLQSAMEAALQSAKPQQSKVELAREYRHKIGSWVYVVAVVIVLLVFTVTYSVGSTIGSAVKEEPIEAVPAAVTPSPLPPSVLLPGVPRITTAKYKPATGAPGVLGATYPAGADVQPVLTAGLPFAFGWPRPPQVTSLGESGTAIYRRVQTAAMRDRPRGTLDARVALHPCTDLAACLADRPAFDKAWTAAFTAPAPETAKDARTWFTEQGDSQKTKVYALTMTHAFISGGQWWLVGVMATGVAGEETDVQRIVNDIWRQTS